MSEQPVTPPKPGQPGKGKPGPLGLTRGQWLGVGGVFVAALVYIVWRQRKAAETASSQGSATNQGSNECTDQAGNPVDCNEAFAQELAAMQNELDQLANAGAATGSGGGSGGGYSGGGGTTGTTGGGSDSGTGAASAPNTTNPTPNTPVTSTGGSPSPAPSTGGGSSSPRPSPPPAPGNVHATKVTASSITVAWNKVSGATSYRIRVTYQSQLVKQQTTGSTSATISGLGANHTYGVHLASVSSAGTGPEGDVNIKTSKL